MSKRKRLEDDGRRKARRNIIANETKVCGYCPPHDGENRGRRPKSDKGKNHRREGK